MLGQSIDVEKPIIICTLDAKTAFDAMKHQALDVAMQNRGLSITSRLALLRELFGKTAFLNIPAAGSSKTFPFLRGGKQGGVETSDEFNLVVESAMEELTRWWDFWEMGFQMDGGSDGEELFHHVTWFDNIFLVASDVDTFAAMAQQLTDCMYSVGFQWKSSSLEILTGGTMIHSPVQVSIHTQGHEIMHFKQVEQLLTLGVMLDGGGSTIASLEHRLERGEACFWANAKAFRSRGKQIEKLKAWSAAPLASAAVGASSWALTKHVVLRLRRWEMKHLRQIFRLRRRPEEGQMAYNVRTARWLDKLRDDLNIPHAHHQVMRAVFRSAWRERHFRDISGSNLLQVIRNYKSQLWWEFVKAAPYKDRRDEGAVHSRTGPAINYETVFVESMGADWRSHRDAHGSYPDWKRRCEELVNELCALWQVPCLPKRQAAGQDVAKEADEKLLNSEALDLMITCIEQPHPGDHRWEYGQKCFLFIGDSQTVVRILNGVYPLRHDTHRVVYSRITARIASLIRSGWQPPWRWDDPFEWRPRCFNVRADAVCNAVMDAGQEISYITKDLEEIKGVQPNYLIYSDGGCRNRGQSAFALVIYAVVRSGETWIPITIAIVGKLLLQDASSFVTETLAIDGASNMLFDMIR